MRTPKKFMCENDQIMLQFWKNLLRRFEDFEKSLSIIIQGPLNNRSINTIPQYLKYGNVIVSCWDNNDLSKLDKYKDSINIVVNKYSDIKRYPSRPGSQAPWILQNHTTYNALMKVETNLSIKVRSDESYPNLDKLIDKLQALPYSKNWSKIITSNIYFRYDREKKFHPSDHIIAGLTSRMRDVFRMSTNLCSRKQPDIDFPEQLICKAVVESHRYSSVEHADILDKSNSKEIMKRHFDIIRISDLPGHIWTSSYRKYDALYSEEDWCHDIKSI